jgi:phage tail-like protein
MASTGRTEIVNGNQFVVTVDSVVQGTVSKVEGLGQSCVVSSYTHGQSKNQEHAAGRLNPATVKLTRPYSADTQFTDWKHSQNIGNVQRHSAAVSFSDRSGAPIGTYNLFDIHVAGWELVTPNANTSDHVMEVVTLTVEKLTFTAG